MSSKRLAIGGVVLAAALVGLVVLLAWGSEDGPGEHDALTAAHCPPRYEVLRAGRHSEAEIARAKRGVFLINGEPVKLSAPVDWTINPERARSFSHTLFKFQWLDPLLYAYRIQGDVEALERATRLVLDFARANPPDGKPVDPDVWDDKRTGDRGPYLAYVLRAASCEGLLDADERDLLLRMMERHAEVLVDPDNYKPTNHGLFVDLGLTLLARQLDFMPRAAEWGRLGRERFERTLRKGTVAGEGFWLEHSAGYQILITRTLTRFLRVPGNRTPGLVDLRRRMQDVVGWLAEPDGRIPQFGDSDLKQVPQYGLLRARDDRGVLELRRSGLAVAKRDRGYLAVLASYFSDAHKHSDALTFDLFDRGRRLITDTGLYHKDRDENFAFAHSERAHSVLTVDGAEFPRDGTDTYGSGILQTGKGNGFLAILGTNPAVAAQGVHHKRLFLYEPGRVLVIVDRLRADQEHRYARFLQFAPEIEVSRDGPSGLRLRAPAFRGAVRSDGAGGERIELARGEHEPLRGLTSPSFRRWVPRWTARLRSKGEDLDHVMTITLDGAPLVAKLVAWTDESIRIDLDGPGSKAEGLKIAEQGGDFRITRVPAESER
jgi:hypothetical protein